jgi:hypothetical protein
MCGRSEEARNDSRQKCEEGFELTNKKKREALDDNLGRIEKAVESPGGEPENEGCRA